MNLKISKYKLITILLLATNLFSMESKAQENEEVSEEVKKLKEQAAIIELQKEISDNQKAIFDNNIAQKKAFDITLPKGDITSTGEHIESTLLSSKTLTTAMTAIVDDLNKKLSELSNSGKNKITLIYYDKNQLSKINEYKALLEELDQMAKDIEVHVIDAESILSVGPLSYGGGLSALALAISVSGTLNAIAGIAAYFKTDATYNTFEVTYDDNDLISSFFEVMNKKNVNLSFYTPSLYPITSSIGTTSTPLSKNIKALNDIKTRIKNAITALDKELKKLKATLKKEKDETKKENLNKAVALVEKTKLTLTGDNSSIETVFKALYAKADGQSHLASILSIEALNTLIMDKDSYVVLLKATGKGGTVSKKGLFINNHLEHSGGATLNCIVFNNNSEVVFTGIRRAYLPYSKLTVDRLKN